ncbi:GTP-binding protein [Perilla frutescens var. hirtella]|nr:GTP-binding protein [Perilla frutescens var. hirtella]
MHALILFILEEFRVDDDYRDCYEPKSKTKVITRESINFTKIPIEKLPTVMNIGRPNVGKSALFNRLIWKRETLVYKIPNDHVTRDIRDGIAKLGDLRFQVLISAGLEAEASSGAVLGRAAAINDCICVGKSPLCSFYDQCKFVLIKSRDGIHMLDLGFGKWLRKHAPGIKTIAVMNKVELLDNITGSLAAGVGEASTLGLGDPIAFCCCFDGLVVVF